MESSYRSCSRAVQLAISGVMIAFAWLLLSVVFGIGVTHAHAEDSDNDRGALSSLTGAVGSVVSGVADAAITTITTVAPPVAPVIETVAVVAPVVTEPVHQLASAGVVTQVVAPVVEIVTAVPLVGDVVTAVGGDAALTETAATLDGAAAALTGTVIETLPGTIPSDSATPGATPELVDVLAGLTTIPDAAAAVPVTAAVLLHSADDAAALVRALFSSITASSGMADSVISAASAHSSSDNGSIVGALLEFFRSAPPADSVFTGSGGAGPGAWALGALVLVVAYRAWMQRHELENDAAPAAPTFATDVSPD